MKNLIFAFVVVGCFGLALGTGYAGAEEKKNVPKEKIAEEKHCYSRTVCDRWDEKNRCLHYSEVKDCR